MVGFVIAVCVCLSLVCLALIRSCLSLDRENQRLQAEIISCHNKIHDAAMQHTSLEKERENFAQEKLDFEEYKAQNELLLSRKKAHFEEYKAHEESILKQRWDEWLADKVSFSNNFQRQQAELETLQCNIEEEIASRSRSATIARTQELDRLSARYQQLLWRLTETCRNLDNDYIAFNNAKADLNRRYKEFDDRYALYNKFIINQLQAFFRNSSTYKLLSGSMVHSHLASGFTLGYNRLYQYIHDETHGVYHELRSLKVEGEIVSGKSIYHTTLYGCSCPDFKNNLKGCEPCKHMYMLAFEIGLLNDLPKYQIISDLKKASEIYKDIVLKEQALRSSQNTKPEA